MQFQMPQFRNLLHLKLKISKDIKHQAFGQMTWGGDSYFGIKLEKRSLESHHTDILTEGLNYFIVFHQMTLTQEESSGPSAQLWFFGFD